jgi:broad specificity phosphatase PhoE
MPARITLLCHGRSTARPSAFAADEPLAEGEAQHIASLASALTGIARVLSSPAKVARQTADALSPTSIIDVALADLNLGRWRGRALSEVEASEPEALATWMADAGFAGHGGESRSALVQRVSSWLEERHSTEGYTFAVTHPVVIQAAMLAILGAPASAFRNIDVPPLQALDIRSDGHRWAIRSFGRL